MMISQGILTARGGLVSHAAVVARGWGTPAVVGAEAVKIDGKSFHVGRRRGEGRRRHRSTAPPARWCSAR
jgi:phosphoenolpyruvate synthase/pyruvate phosphate dikinase